MVNVKVNGIKPKGNEPLGLDLYQDQFNVLSLFKKLHRAKKVQGVKLKSKN